MTIHWTSDDCDGQVYLKLHLSVGQVINLFLILTTVVPLILAFLILSNFVTSHIHLNILIMTVDDTEQAHSQLQAAVESEQSAARQKS